MNTELSLLADLVLPGTKGVVHELVLEDGPAWKEWGFVGFPMRGFHGVERLEPGRPFRFSGKYGTRIYAVPIGEDVPAELDAAWCALHANSTPPVGEVKHVGTWDPLERVLTRVRVDGVEGTSLRLSVATETREHAWPPFLSWAVPIVLVAGGIALIVRLRRGRRACCSG